MWNCDLVMCLVPSLGNEPYSLRFRVFSRSSQPLPPRSTRRSCDEYAVTPIGRALYALRCLMPDSRSRPLILAFALFSVLTSTAPATALAAAKKPAAKGPATIMMPDARSGMDYPGTTIDPGKVPWKQPQCLLVVDSPAWLKIDCSSSTFKFSGKVPTITKDAEHNFKISVIDGVTGIRYDYPAHLIERPAVEVIPLDKAAADAEAKAVATAPDYSNLTLQQTTPITEGATQAAGVILNLPGKAAIHIQVWTRPENGAGPAALMSLINSAAPPATVQQIDLKGNSYSLQFPAPLAAGQIIRLKAVKDDGTIVKEFDELLLGSAITIGTMSLTLEKPVVVGAKTVSGTLSSMPFPAVKPTAASGNVPASYGNFPGIVVWLRDSVSGTWSQVAPPVGANPPQFLSVGADGSFVVTLPATLQSGQTIRVDVVPPPGRSFAGFAPLLPPPSPIVAQLSQWIQALNNVALSQPTIATSPLNEGTTTISGTATSPSGGVPAGIVVLRLKNQPRGLAGDEEPQEIAQGCFRIDELGAQTLGRILPLTTSSSNALVGPVDATAGTYKVTLTEALKQDDWIQVVQVLPAGASLPGSQTTHCASTPLRVTYPFDFFRTNLSVVAGVLISNSSASSATSANFSQANQFYAFNADHAWRLPGYDCVALSKWGNPNRGHCPQADGWHSSPLLPGNDSFFEGRFTAIPVSTAAATVTTTNSASTSTTPTLLSSQKVFRVETGVYLPWVLVHGQGDHPQGLFIGPLAKAGFDTVTGAGTATNVILPGGAVGTLNFQTAYKFYAYGARLGNMSLSQSPNRAPLLEHYLDITVGRYSNLQSYICHYAKDPLQVAQPGSSCFADYPNIFKSLSDVADSRKQLYRIDLEGLVRVPVPATAIPFYIGFNANIAQHTWQAENVDHGYAPPDDIRILFGTKIDIGTLLSSLKLGAN